ncbi:MAG TPA: PepSY-like domain-containing protein [Chitinophagaceae bacterium]|nr:PepSY-like domain-containing protein [Chitinophagaceae bacterium]HUM65354.1 PepSY-like domain-containing protein [Chitinophagaceae bacterium]
MKKTLLAALLITALSLGLNAQDGQKVKDADLPAAIKTSFQSEFPDARDVEWVLKDGHYKVEFEVKDVDNIAAFDASGKLLKKGIEIKQSELPAAVSSALQSAHAGKDIDDVYKMEKDGTSYYLVKFDGNPKTKVMYSPEGQEIKDK